MIRKTDSKFNRLLSVFLFAGFSFVAGQVNGQARFIENKGQWPDQVAYKLAVANADLYFEKDRLTWNFVNPDRLEAHDHSQTHRHSHLHHQSELDGHAYHVNFLGASPQVKIEGKNPFNDYINYLLGNDPEKWASHVKPFAQTNYRDLYPGIDLEFFQRDDDLKYDVIIEANADPSLIRMEYIGMDEIKIQNKNLIVSNSFNTIEESIPEAYQIIGGEKHLVSCEYVLEGNTVSFSFPNGYDQSVELVVDPTLVFSTFTGSEANNFGFTATYDSLGNAYAGGLVYSDDYPLTLGAYQLIYGGEREIGITKFNELGTDLIYSTYLGGEADEVASSMIVNSSGQLVILGATGSTDFPTSINGYDNSFNGGTVVNYPSNGTNFQNGTDLFVSVVSADGDSIIGSTFIGGTGNDGLNSNEILLHNYGDQFRGEVILDDSDNVLVVSSTTSVDFPVSVNAYDESFGGGQDACLIKLSENVDDLLWSTYVGGDSADAGYSVRVSENSDLVICGGTSSSNLNVGTTGMNPAYLGGASDGFVIRLSGNGENLLAGSYLGTSSLDQAYHLDVRNNEVYLLGQSSGDYPVSAVYQNVGSSQFIQKMDSSLSTSIFSTVFGSGTSDINISPTAFMIDHNDRIYLSGWGGTTNASSGSPGMGNTIDMPVTWNALQSTTDGSDVYFMVLEADAEGILFGSYFGGSDVAEHVDGGTSRFNPSGVIYQAVCAGCGPGLTFPTTPGVWSEVDGSGNLCNLAVVKIDMDLDSVVLGVEPISSELTDRKYSNVFTPNGDGKNDCFEIGTHSRKNFSFQVLDRWGAVRFYTENSEIDCWDGRDIQGIRLPQGTYYYLVNSNGIQHRGYVMLKE